jgi:hypothetical protein
VSPHKTLGVLVLVFEVPRGSSTTTATHGCDIRRAIFGELELKLEFASGLRPIVLLTGHARLISPHIPPYFLVLEASSEAEFYNAFWCFLISESFFILFKLFGKNLGSQFFQS